MKKSVVILIAVIYVAAVAVVSFFGINPELLEETVYVTDIHITNQDTLEYESGKPYVIIYTDSNGYAEYKIDWQVTPTESTNTNVNFDYDKKNNFVTVSETGLVRFNKSGVVTIYLTPADGSILKNEDGTEKVVSIEIWAMSPQ